MLIVKSTLAKCCYAGRNDNLSIYSISKAVFECILADIRQGFRQCKGNAFRRISQSHDLQRSAIREYGSAVRITKACQCIRENKGFQGCAIAKRKFADGRYLGLGQVNRCHRRVHKCLIVDLLQIGCIAEIDSNNFFSIKSILTDTRHRRTVNYRRNGNGKGLILIFGKPIRINARDHAVCKVQLFHKNVNWRVRCRGCGQQHGRSLRRNGGFPRFRACNRRQYSLAVFRCFVRRVCRQHSDGKQGQHHGGCQQPCQKQLAELLLSHKKSSLLSLWTRGRRFLRLRQPGCRAACAV